MKARESHEITEDTVIRELRATKERLAAACGFDVKRIAADPRANQQHSGRKVVSRDKESSG